MEPFELATSWQKSRRNLMTNSDNTQNKASGGKLGIGVALGVAIGAAIGVAMDNIAMGMGVGLAIGIALGLAMDQQRSNTE
jgi:F0F1-type ATP synthase assembly protein I